MDTNDGQKLAMKGGSKVKFADVVSGDQRINMMFMLGGCHNAGICVQNVACSYRIRGIPDKIPGVWYRTDPKGWMDRRVFPEWLE